LLFNTYDSAHGYTLIPASRSNWMMVNFTIGSKVVEQYYIAVKDLYPANNDVNGIGAVGNGASFSIMTNSTSEAEIDVFVVRVEEGGSANWSHVIARGQRSFMFDYKFHYDWDVEYYGIGWEQFTLSGSYIRPRETYFVFLGIWHDATNPALIEWSTLYDDSYIGNFTYYKALAGEYGIVPYIEDDDDWAGKWQFSGVWWSFGTYPEGESPSTYDSNDDHDYDTTYENNMGERLDKWGAKIGIGYLSMLAGLLIIALFSMFPIVANVMANRNRGYAKELPFIIQIGFTVLGLLMAFSMGLFPLWIIALLVAIVMILFVYKVIGWVKSRKEGGGDAE